MKIHTTMRLILSVLLMTCIFAGGAYGQTPRLIKSPLNLKGDSIWEANRIAVCWENPTAANLNQRNNVTGAIQQTWVANSALQFTGWGQCTASSRGIRIRIANEHPHVKALGKHLDGMPNGVVLNFSGGWPINPVAVHEFGHALGFSHEQNRSDAPLWCRDQHQGTDGDIYITPFDINSVMNYCNPNANNGGNLSISDIAGLQIWYGTNPTGEQPWEANCQSYVLLMQDSNFRSRKLLLSGTMQNLSVVEFSDKASSLCVPSGFRLSIYEHDNFRGKAHNIFGPAVVRSLPNEWNDVISSIRIFDSITGNEIYEAPTECRTSLVLFENDFFRGKSLRINNNWNSLRDFNDVTSSLCVPSGRSITLWEHDNFKGESLLLVGPRSMQVLPSGWNDRVSSVQFR